MASKLGDELYKRMRFIEGQARGVQRMIEESRNMNDILTQLLAIEAAARSAADLITQKDLLQHLEETITQAVQNCVEQCELCEGLVSKALGEVDYTEVLEELLKLSRSTTKPTKTKSEKKTPDSAKEMLVHKVPEPEPIASS